MPQKCRGLALPQECPVARQSRLAVSRSQAQWAWCRRGHLRSGSCSARTEAATPASTRLLHWRPACQEAPAIRICETNSPYNSHRSAFFTTIADFLARHNGNRMLTFWNAKEGLAHGGLDGPWPPQHQIL
jgi:hypothetical protein